MSSSQQKKNNRQHLTLTKAKTRTQLLIKLYLSSEDSISKLILRILVRQVHRSRKQTIVTSIIFKDSRRNRWRVLKQDKHTIAMEIQNQILLDYMEKIKMQKKYLLMK